MSAPLSIQGRRVLVTGAGGFIGSALIQQLMRHGAHVRALTTSPRESPLRVPRQVRSVRCDVTNLKTIGTLARDVDTLVHLAGPASVSASFDASRHYVRTHVMGTVTVLEVCRRYGIKRIVYISSAEVYGRPPTPRVSEDATLQPLSPYAAAKAGAEKLVEAFSSAFGLEAVILRPFAIYGPGLSGRSLIGTVIRQTRRGRSAVLRDLRPVRDFCHVTDVADAIVRACAAALPLFTILNVGSGRGTSVEQVARRIVRLRRRRVQVRARSTPPLLPGRGVDRLVADPRRAGRLLGWSARVPLSAGLQETIHWMDTR
jgi:nucleoside-diphosphate-sugar epimerase